MAEFSQTNHLNLRYQLGSSTDIGGGRENQDESLIWIKSDVNLIVVAIFDGHGREVGKTAALAAKACLKDVLDAEHEALLRSPVDFLVYAHEKAHLAIRDSFQARLEKEGYQVRVTDEGYLVKRRSNADYWSCVHGGTSCSIAALIGNMVYCSNVGDSTALMCVSQPILHRSCIHFERDAAVDNISGGSVVRDSAAFSNNEQNLPSKVMVLSAEHSPESPYEFERLRKYRQREGDNLQPALFVVYDSPAHDKSHCQPVFDPSSPELIPSQRGSYYKNVRKEWASLVSTPPSAKYQDALAFTRSLGDLHLHTYGVTHLPEIHRVDLVPIFQELHQLRISSSSDSASVITTATELSNGNSNLSSVFDISLASLSPAEQLASSTICIVLCSDGFWDNWVYEDVGRFMMDASCLGAIASSHEGAQKVANSFMARNMGFSRRNFGNQADNATAVLLYLSYSPAFST